MQTVTPAHATGAIRAIQIGSADQSALTLDHNFARIIDGLGKQAGQAPAPALLSLAPTLTAIAGGLAAVARQDDPALTFEGRSPSDPASDASVAIDAALPCQVQHVRAIHSTAIDQSAGSAPVQPPASDPSGADPAYHALPDKAPTGVEPGRTPVLNAAPGSTGGTAISAIQGGLTPFALAQPASRLALPTQTPAPEAKALTRAAEFMPRQTTEAAPQALASATPRPALAARALPADSSAPAHGAAQVRPGAIPAPSATSLGVLAGLPPAALAIPPPSANEGPAGATIAFWPLAMTPRSGGLGTTPPQPDHAVQPAQNALSLADPVPKASWPGTQTFLPPQVATPTGVAPDDRGAAVGPVLPLWQASSSSLQTRSEMVSQLAAQGGFPASAPLKPEPKTTLPVQLSHRLPADLVQSAPRCAPNPASLMFAPSGADAGQRSDWRTRPAYIPARTGLDPTGAVALRDINGFEVGQVLSTLRLSVPAPRTEQPVRQVSVDVPSDGATFVAVPAAAASTTIASTATPSTTEGLTGGPVVAASGGVFADAPSVVSPPPVASPAPIYAPVPTQATSLGGAVQPDLAAQPKSLPAQPAVVPGADPSSKVTLSLPALVVTYPPSVESSWHLRHGAQKPPADAPLQGPAAATGDQKLTAAAFAGNAVQASVPDYPAVADRPDAAALAADPGAVSASGHMLVGPAMSGSAVAASVAASVAQQMIAQIALEPEGIIDVALNPEELGRLRFELHQHGDQVRVHLVAERPDTLDLLRRHADELLAELRQAGFGGAELSFGAWGKGRSHPAAANASSDADGQQPAASLPGPAAPSSQHASPGAGLHLRL